MRESSERTKLSIIILNWNTKDLLVKCINSILQDKVSLSHLGRIQIIIVDNHSSDGSQKVIQELERKSNKNIAIKAIYNNENVGFAKGNNLGLAFAKGKFILFLNSDTQLFPGALKESINYLEKHPDVGALTPKTLLATGKMDPDCHRGFPTPWASLCYFLGLEKLFPKSRLFGQYHKFYLNLDENHEIDAGAGAFMLIPRKIIDEIGNWDENYFFYGEDLDFYYRIKKAGYKTIFYAKPLLKHYKGASSGLRKESKKLSVYRPKENRIRVARASVQAMEIFYQKFYKNRYPKIITFLILSAIRIKGILRILKQYLS